MRLDLSAYQTALERERLDLAIFHFDPSEHPRDPLGRFKAVLQEFLSNPDKNVLKLTDSNLTVTKTPNRRLRLFGGQEKLLATPDDLDRFARKALGQWGRDEQPKPAPPKLRAPMMA